MAGRRASASRALVLAALSGLPGCDSAGTGPGSGPAELVVGTPEIHLGYAREATLELRNDGGRPAGPVSLRTDPVRRSDGPAVSDAELAVEPSTVATLAAGASATVHLSVRLPWGSDPGGYASAVWVSSDLGQIRVPVDFAVRDASADDVASVSIHEAPEAVRQGDVAPIRAEARDTDGLPLEAAPLTWSTVPADAALVEGGRFVAFEPGALRLVAASGSAADSVELEVTARGVEGGTITVKATSPTPGRVTADLWVHGHAAYAGTWFSRADRPKRGNALVVWDVSDPGAPTLTDSLIVDAQVVNDVKVSADGDLGVLTHEISDDKRNGVSLLDLSDPHHPEVITRFTDELETGVHNVWLDGDYLYAAVDGTPGGLRIVDVEDPSAPAVVASYYAGHHVLHDVYVRDGLAFLSHWDAGLVILDVGAGIAGGSPTAPVEVTRLGGLGGQTHNAWYWPESGYVFVGEEDFGTPGVMHVVDVSDPTDPREVATFAVPGEAPHNFWVDEDRGILYAAWYSRGVRAIDVGGELLGPLERQGREIASAVYGSDGQCPPLSTMGTCTWAPQLHEGTLFLADMESGLVVATPPR